MADLTGERMFTQARQKQGFRSQAHLDAFFRSYDHERSCAECGKPGPAVWLEGSASWQPTMAQCQTGKDLDQAHFAFLGR